MDLTAKYCQNYIGRKLLNATVTNYNI